MVTCLKDRRFLNVFFRRLQLNQTGRYENEFPFVSPCQGELNYCRAADTGIVFHDLVKAKQSGDGDGDGDGGGRLRRGWRDADGAGKGDGAEAKTGDGDGDGDGEGDGDVDGDGDGHYELVYGASLKVVFDPSKLVVNSRNGRVYHAAPLGHRGLLRSALCLRLQHHFKNESEFEWKQKIYTIPHVE